MNNNARHIVIDLSVMLEGIMTKSIASILNIDLDSSKSFGDSVSALSFMQKVRLIQDIKGVEKIRISKLQTFLEIRNKFAHLYTIDSFSSYANYSEHCEKSIQNLKKWYPKSNEVPSDFETNSKNLFQALYQDCFDFLIALAMRHNYDKAAREGRELAMENLLKEVQNELDLLPDGQDVWLRALNNFKEKGKKKNGT